jgi:Cap4-like dsDNA endonuclease family protein
MQEILEITNKKGLAETGGGHGQKGVDFQRYWAVLRMFELEQAGAQDFLLLFESIQDVAELDASGTPTAVKIYQIKKKERSEWTWAQITGLPGVKKTSKKKTASKKKKKTGFDKKKIGESPIGKLYLSVISFEKLKSEGRFISNMGCDIPLASGGNMATSLPADLSQLSSAHVELLNEGLAVLTTSEVITPDLKRLTIERTSLPVDTPEKHLIGVVFTFLDQRSPKHAAQAKSLVEALIAQISPLGRKTDKCTNLEDLIKERGYSRTKFAKALGDLETVPDREALLESWLTRLLNEGMNLMVVTRVRVAAAGLFRRRLFSLSSARDKALEAAIEAWITANPVPSDIFPYLEAGVTALGSEFEDYKKEELLARIVLKEIEKCEAPISSS